MNLTGTGFISNYVFDGDYFFTPTYVDPLLSSFWTGLGINPTGISGVPVYYNSGNQFIDLGYLTTGVSSFGSYLSGATANITPQSGYIYYDIFTPLYGRCHGVGQDNYAWFSGWNFYNGFHPAGYIAPPYGENVSLYMSTQDGTYVLQEDGSCANLSDQEYGDIFGIVSTTDAGIQSVTPDELASSLGFINSPAIECPVNLGLNYYWNEIQLKLIAGTAAAITANTFFNSNPIPTSLDIFNLQTTLASGRYKATGTPSTSGLTTYGVVYDASGRPVPSYPTSGGSNILNSQVCFAVAAETSTAWGVSVESELLNVPDSTITAASQSSVAAAGALFDPFNWWIFEKFLFKENSDGFPFTDGYNTLDNGQVSSAQSDNYGSQLFNYQLADSNNYWENRQCPNVVDFLPHTFGASILACPSYYFDAPYYAVTKKFGFYGARFFNGCVNLDFAFTNSGNSNASGYNTIEIQNNLTFQSDTEADGEPQPDEGTNWSFAMYDNLLAVALSEEQHSDFYALNQPLFFWFNYPLITGSSAYQTLTSSFSGFSGLFAGSFGTYANAFPSGKSGLLGNSYLSEDSRSFIMYDTGATFPSLSSDNGFSYYVNEINSMVGISGASYWQSLSNTFGNAVLSSIGNVDTGFYYTLQTGRNSRFLTRYLENFVRGNPIDLYPSNKIWFGTEPAIQLLDSSSWGKSPVGFGNGTQFTDTGLNRRFFLGAYGNGGNISGYINYVSNLANIQNDFFYPGYFNANIGQQLPQPAYIQVITGNIYSGSQNVTDTTITNGQNPISNGWLGIGYNGVGQLNGNFSCFTPIFVQQPLSTVFCKIGQSPVFRAYAVDYHTIPEDKISIRYPEIVYWTQKLKMIDQNYNNKYPLSYSWYRVPTGNYGGNFQNFLTNPNFALVEPANYTGTWASLEGSGPYCTLIHAQSCIPVVTGNSGEWSYGQVGTVAYQNAQINNFYMTFKKGAIKGVDDQYFYFCMVTGRFGIRIIEPSTLFIEDLLQFDVAIQNGANATLSLPITFQGGNGQSITVNPSTTAPYAGFERDDDAIPESIVQEKIPPPDAGFGDAYSYQFIGPWKYKGALNTYSPGTLNDTRGLTETWNRMLDYGSLTHYSTTLTQAQGDMLYGYNHLPVCTDTFAGGQIQGMMSSGQSGVSMQIPGIVHWANMQTPTVSTNGTYGPMWNTLGNAGELYTPGNPVGYADYSSASPGLGQWQWGNNLGTIHSFGTNSTLKDITASPGPFTAANLQQLQSGLLKNGVLGGSNCGWNQCGLGRNMLYFIEGWDAFYIFCDNIKKKNVQNTNYMNPGLRQTNSSIQYFWLGKPSNCYVQRYPMFGPYSYQWKLARHNRDRNGNGMPESFYSYGWNQNFNLMYDAPAVYGLFRKQPNQNSTDVATIVTARNNAMGGAQNTLNIQSIKFGFTYSNQQSVTYGDIFVGDIDNRTPTALQAYVGTGAGFAASVPFGLYGCSDTDLNNGECFDPCLSIRYANGIFPGGKTQALAPNFPSGHGYNIVANNIFASAPSFNASTVTGLSGVYFRGPFGTPHFKYLSTKGYSMNGFSPCADGGGDHCNYITPTLNLGTSCYYQAAGPSYITAVNNATRSVNYGPPKL